MLSALMHKYTWAFFKPLLIETYLYLLVGAVVFAVLFYVAKKVLKVKIKWSISFIVLLLFTQYFWYKHSSTLDILAGKLPMSTQIGMIDQATHTIKGDGKHGFLAYGPYLPLAKGNYKVTYKLQSNDLPQSSNLRNQPSNLCNQLANRQVGFCDVNVLDHPENNTRIDLVQDTFKKQNPQDISLVYAVPEDNTKVEFRVFQYGGNALALNNLTVAPAGVREVLLKNKDQIFKGTIYIFGALLFIAIYWKSLTNVQENSTKKVIKITSGVAVISGLIMAFIWHWKGFSNYAFHSYYDMWRVFYAPAWLPLMFIFFNFLYLTNNHLGFNKEIEKYLKYDRYTLLVLPAFIITELMVKTINTHMLLGNFYLGTLVVKSIIYFIFLWQNLKEQQDIQPGKAVKWTIFLSVFTVYLLITPWVNAAFYTDGDETIYLLQTQSIIKDNDLDITSNIINIDNSSYHTDVSWTSWKGKYVHAGLSLILMPGMLLGGRFGTTLIMNLLGSLLALNIFILSFRITQSSKSSYFSMLACTFLCPLGIYSMLLYTEIAGAVLVIYLMKKLLISSESNFKDLFWILLSSLVLIFIKERYASIAVLAIVIIIYKNRRNYKLILLILGFILAGLSILILYDRIFNNLARTIRLIGLMMLLPVQFTQSFYGLAGQLLDQESGLLIYAPVYLVSFLGLISLLRYNKRVFMVLVSMFVPYYVIVSSFGLWSSLGGSPAPRYIVAIIPILSIATGVYLTYNKKLWVKLVLLVAWLWSLGMYYILLLIPQIRVHSPNNITGRNEILDLLYALNILPNLTVLFPSFQKPTDTTYFLTILFVIIFVILAISYVKQEKQPLEIFNSKKAIKLVIAAIIVVGFVLVLAKSTYYNWQKFDTVNCYSGGGIQLSNGTMLNGGGFFVLTKVALKKEEKTIIRVKAKAVFNDGWPILNVATGTDNLHEIIGKVEINSNDWQEYQVEYIPKQGGLLPFWFEHANFIDRRDISLAQITFMGKRKSPLLGYLNYQIGKFDETIHLTEFATQRYEIAAALGYPSSLDKLVNSKIGIKKPE